MLRLRIILFCIMGLILVGLAVGLLKYQRLKEEPETALSLLGEKSNVSLDTIHHVATRDGVKEWVLDAQSVQYRAAEKTTILKGVSVTFFLEDGETIYLTGNDGILFTSTKDMELSGNVVVQSGSHELKTEELYYDYQARSVSTNTPVTVKGDGVWLSGNNMKFSFEDQKGAVWGNVRAVFENSQLMFADS